ncbi:MAG: hypothetical protein ACO3NK_18980 [Prochlorotrichaceae cyanobacterium]|jgi:hypothetical protein
MNLKSMLSGASLGTIALVSSLSVLGGSTAAQAEETIKVYANPAEALEMGYFQNGKNSYDSMSLLGQWLGISGASAFPRGSYPEISIERDNRIVNAVYQDVLMQQTMSDPFLRVPDLPNPYNTSLMTLPSLQTGRVIGTELVYDRRPMP